MGDEVLDRTCGARWLERIDGPGYASRPAASDAELSAAELKLNTALPPALRALYLRSDGVWDRSGQWYVIWPLDHLVARNGGVVGARTGLAFGDDGTGDPFCIHADGSVTFWSEIDGEHAWLASDLESFWAAWVRDELPPH